MKPIISLSCLFFILFSGCNSKIKEVKSEVVSIPIEIDGKYDSHFPVTSVDKEISRIEKTIKLITNLTFYQAYDFSINSRIQFKDLNKKNIEQRSIRKYVLEKPASGTATVIARSTNRVALLTCEHIVLSEDTLINYYLDETGKPTEYVQSIAIKSRESINIISMPWLKNIEILASDKDLDIAVVVATLYVSPNLPIPVFNFKMGKAAELNWGTFVYIFGFPNGKKLISTAIVSNPNRDKNKGFIVDATMHRGVSGGLILALRDGAPNFELVGIASAISAEREYILRPNGDLDLSEIHFGQPYEGKIFLDKQMKINYGITYAVSIEAIQEFISDNKKTFLKEGLNL
jgi:hypothetical protein